MPDKQSTSVNPMVPLLTGWLLSSVIKEGRDSMKIVAVEAMSSQGFEITFAS